MEAVKELRRLKYDVPSALKIADGVACLGVAAVAGGSASGGGSGAGIPSRPNLKFAFEQTGNLDETPVRFDSAGKTTVAANVSFALVFVVTALALAFPVLSSVDEMFEQPFVLCV